MRTVGPQLCINSTRPVNERNLLSSGPVIAGRYRPAYLFSLSPWKSLDVSPYEWACRVYKMYSRRHASLKRLLVELLAGYRRWLCIICILGVERNERNPSAQSILIMRRGSRVCVFLELNTTCETSAINCRGLRLSSKFSTSSDDESNFKLTNSPIREFLKISDFKNQRSARSRTILSLKVEKFVGSREAT